MTETKTTEYVVLRFEGVAAWANVATVAAPNAKAAIAQVVKEGEGTFVAVPASSFRPVRVTVKQQTKLSFGEPKAEIAEPPAA